MDRANWLILLERPVAVIIWTTTPMQAMTTAMLATVRPPFSRPATNFFAKDRMGLASRMMNCWSSPTTASPRIARERAFWGDSPIIIRVTSSTSGIKNTIRLT